MHLDKSNISCGIYQLNQIFDERPDAIVKFVQGELKARTVMNRYVWTKAHRRPPAIIFSDVAERGNLGGDALSKYITNNDLGEVYETPPFVNTTVGRNNIKLWTWLLNYEKLGLQEVAEDFKE